MKYAFAFIIVALANVPVHANSALKLSGSVVDIGVGCAYGKPYASVTLLMQFYNAGNEPVIVTRPYFDFQTRVLFVRNSSDRLNDKSVTGDVLTYNPYLDDPHGVVTSDDYDHLPGLIRSLKRAAEEKNSKPLTDWKVIEPGGYFEFRQGLIIRNGFKFVKSLDAKGEKCDSKNFKAFPENDSFTVEYLFSLKKYKEADDLFPALRDAWRSHGNLILNADGNILYKSESITIPNDEQARQRPTPHTFFQNDLHRKGF